MAKSRRKSRHVFIGNAEIPPGAEVVRITGKRGQETVVLVRLEDGELVEMQTGCYL